MVTDVRVRKRIANARLDAILVTVPRRTPLVDEPLNPGDAVTVRVGNVEVDGVIDYLMGGNEVARVKVSAVREP